MIDNIWLFIENHSTFKRLFKFIINFLIVKTDFLKKGKKKFILHSFDYLFFYEDFISFLVYHRCKGILYITFERHINYIATYLLFLFF